MYMAFAAKEMSGVVACAIAPDAEVLFVPCIYYNHSDIIAIDMVGI